MIEVLKVGNLQWGEWQSDSHSLYRDKSPPLSSLLLSFSISISISIGRQAGTHSMNIEQTESSLSRDAYWWMLLPFHLGKAMDELLSFPFPFLSLPSFIHYTEHWFITLNIRLLLTCLLKGWLELRAIEHSSRPTSHRPAAIAKTEYTQVLFVIIIYRQSSSILI